MPREQTSRLEEPTREDEAGAAYPLRCGASATDAGSCALLYDEPSDFPDAPLTLVGWRKRREPIYVLTTEPVATAEEAWSIVFASMRRWRIEISFLHLKSDLAIESIRRHLGGPLQTVGAAHPDLQVSHGADT